MRSVPFHPSRISWMGLGTLVLVSVGLAACRDVSVTEVEVASISVSPEASTLRLDETVQLSAVPRDAAGEPLAGRPLTWSSQDPEVATVDETGMVRGQAPGVTEVRASAGGLSGSASITVVQSPEIRLSDSEALFEAESGDVSTEPVSVEISNAGDGTLSGLSISLSFEEGGPEGWLDAELGGATAPTSLSLRALPEGLPVGTHRAQVEVASEVAVNSPQVLDAVLEVSQQSASVVVDPGALGFASAEGQPAPGPQTVAVTNGGDGELTGLSVEVVYDADQPEGWLGTELSSPQAPAELTVTVDPSDLEPGVYDATVEVRSTSAPGSVGEVGVRFTFGEAPPEIGLDREEVVWNLVEGEDDPSPVTVAIENLGSGTLEGIELRVERSGGGPSGWFTASLAGTTAPTTMTLQVSAEDLEPGELAARVLVLSEDAINSPQEVNVAVTVAARPSAGNSTIDADPDAILADGVSTSTITVQLIDPRGDPLTSGGHTVTLATTRGTLSDVTDEGDGSYTATLRSQLLAVGTAVVTGQVNGEDIDDSAQVAFTLLPASPERSTIEAEPTSIQADGSSSSVVTVRLLDSEGNPLPEGGDAVTLSSSAGTLSAVTDEGDGTYSATLASTATPGTAVVTGSVNGEAIDDEAEVEFVAAPSASPETSTIQADPSTLEADGSDTSTITVRLADAQGNPLTSGGDNVSLAASAGALSPISDQGDGSYTATLTAAATPGTAVVTGTVNGDPIDDSAEVEFVPGDPSASETTAQVPAGTVGEATPITITVRDANGHLVSGAAGALSVSVSGGPNSGTSLATIQDNGDGTYTTSYVPAEAGTDEISILLDGAGISGSPFTSEVG